MFYGQLSASETKYATLIEDNIQPNGWIYNPKVSPTNIATRMKSEYLMSMAMGVEILQFHGMLSKYKTRFEATLAILPATPYLSAEYFRLAALSTIGAVAQAPCELDGVLTSCKVGEGFCDFSVGDKRDDYMGTLKRTARDFAVHSPISTLHAWKIASFCDGEARDAALATVKQFAIHLKQHPMEIPAFKIRDLIDIPFGTDVSPMEILAASALATSYDSEKI
jgi:hypothetical protein